MDMTRLVIGPLLAAAAISLAIEPGQTRGEPGSPVATATSLFAIVFRAGPAWKAGLPMSEQGLAEHGRYWARLFESGRVFSAGRMGPDGGLVLLHARDLAEAEAVLAADPAVTDGIFIGEARPYVPRFLSKQPLTINGR